MASSSAAGGTPLQVAPINAQLDKLWAPEVRPVNVPSCSQCAGATDVCTSQPPKLACSPLQMLAYNVETVPCLVLLQPDGEGRQGWHHLLLRCHVGFLVVGALAWAAKLHLNLGACANQFAAGRAVCKTPAPRSRQQMEAALAEMVEHAGRIKQQQPAGKR